MVPTEKTINTKKKKAHTELMLMRIPRYQQKRMTLSAGVFFVLFFLADRERHRAEKRGNLCITFLHPSNMHECREIVNESN